MMAKEQGAQNRKRVLIGDALVVVLVLLLAGGIAVPFLLAPSEHLYCEIWQDGTLLHQIQLAEGYEDTFEIAGDNGVRNTVEIVGERVRIAHSNCPDQVCVQTGWLSRAGQTSVCLPSKVIVKLVNADANAQEIDAVVR